MEHNNWLKYIFPQSSANILSITDLPIQLQDNKDADININFLNITDLTIQRQDNKDADININCTKSILY